MKLKVNGNCVGCGSCCAAASNIFDFGDEGYAEVIVDEISDEDMAAALVAKDNCPVGAIEEVTEEEIEKEDN